MTEEELKNLDDMELLELLNTLEGINDALGDENNE